MRMVPITAWCIAGLLAALTAHVVYVSLRERRGRAATVGGCLLGSSTLLWCAAIVFLPGLHGTVVILFLAAVAALAALMFTPIGKHPAVPLAPTERFDERLVMFARARYRPGDGRYKPFYQEHPQLKEPDDAIREMPRLGEPGGATWDPLNAPVQDGAFPLDGVKDCLKAARPVYGLLGAKTHLVAMHPAGGHDFPPEVRKAAYAFVDRALEHGEDTAESAIEPSLKQPRSRPE